MAGNWGLSKPGHPYSQSSIAASTHYKKVVHWRIYTYIYIAVLLSLFFVVLAADDNLCSKFISVQ